MTQLPPKIDDPSIEYLELMNEDNDHEYASEEVAARELFREMEEERRYFAEIRGEEFKPVWVHWPEEKPKVVSTKADTPAAPKEKPARKPRPNNVFSPRPIYCLETGEQWGTIREAAKKFGLSNCVLGKFVKSGKPCKGFTFVRVGEVHKPPQANTDTRFRPIRCIDTGEEYGGIREAAGKLGFSSEMLGRAIKAGKRYKGMTFERVG